jgi:hypothetical protein
MPLHSARLLKITVICFRAIIPNQQAEDGTDLITADFKIYQIGCTDYESY